MSGFLQTSSCGILGVAGMNSNSDVLQPSEYCRFLYYINNVSSERESDVLWPRSRLRGAAFEASHTVWDWISWAAPSGGHVPKKVTGVTLDANGNPLAGATVSLYNTATGLLVDTQTSDSAGNYQCGDPNAVACFVVAYKAGSPDIAAATVTTLFGV